ncbi:sigma-70 family RNA polymerase sigma factor [Nisaea sp.]|uniref:sigma-70 family RNA polymerase sigma factor n=1 Tax=Nisaea sp. TaxID=2024842 RepID=UPI003B529142
MFADKVDIVGQIDVLRRYARVLTRDASAADDLVQSTLLRAHERSATFRTGSDVRVWLMSILHNIFIDDRRSARATEARERAWVEMHPGFSPPSGENAARLGQIREAFFSLVHEQREALHLVAVEGLELAEAAKVLGVPTGTVMSRVGRARKALRKYEESGPKGAITRTFRVVGGRHEKAD